MNQNFNFQKDNHRHGKEGLSEVQEIACKSNFRTVNLNSILYILQNTLLFPGPLQDLSEHMEDEKTSPVC